jgi:lysine/ornithine N-monooxygenase
LSDTLKKLYLIGLGIRPKNLGLRVAITNRQTMLKYFGMDREMQWYLLQDFLRDLIDEAKYQ